VAAPCGGEGYALHLRHRPRTCHLPMLYLAVGALESSARTRQHWRRRFPPRRGTGGRPSSTLTLITRAFVRHGLGGGRRAWSLPRCVRAFSMDGRLNALALKHERAVGALQKLRSAWRSWLVAAPKTCCLTAAGGAPAQACLGTHIFTLCAWRVSLLPQQHAALFAPHFMPHNLARARISSAARLTAAILGRMPAASTSLP